MKIKAIAHIERVYETSGAGSLEDNEKEARNLLQVDMNNGNIPEYDIAYDFKPVLGKNYFYADVRLNLVNNTVEFYADGVYLASTYYKDLDNAIRARLDLIKKETLPDAPEDMTLHVFRNSESDISIWVECKVDEIFPDDPGRGTPLMVYMTSNGKECSSTLHCALDQGVLESNSNDFAEQPLGTEQFRNLQAVGKHAIDWLDEATEYIRKYGKPNN